MNYCLQLSQVLNIDVIDIINDKMDKTEKKYPLNKAKGVVTKYNKFSMIKNRDVSRVSVFLKYISANLIL